MNASIIASCVCVSPTVTKMIVDSKIFEAMKQYITYKFEYDDDGQRILVGRIDISNKNGVE